MERIYELMMKEPGQLSNDEIVEVLEHRYKPTKVPPCRICGGKLSIGSVGGGHATRWACSGMEDDPDNPGHTRYKEGRTIADQHYADSVWEDHRQGGDSTVMELISRFRAKAAGQ